MGLFALDWEPTMTRRRDLKRRIRVRQRLTGERYTDARAAVLAAKTTPSWVVELHDIGALARELGFTCGVRVTAALFEHGLALAAVLVRLRELLRDRELAALRRVALDGAGDPSWSSGAQYWRHGGTVVLLEQLRRFFAGLARGERGPGPAGRTVAFDVELGAAPRVVIAQLVPRFRGDPLLVLALHDDLTLDIPGAVAVPAP